MAKSFKDALLQARLIKPQDTDEARREGSWRERQEKDAAEVADKMADTTPRLQWESPPSGRIVERSKAAAAPTSILCSECKQPFDPTAPEHRKLGRYEQCGPCAKRAKREEMGPPRKRGRMMWARKPAPAPDGPEVRTGSAPASEEPAAVKKR